MRAVPTTRAAEKRFAALFAPPRGSPRRRGSATLAAACATPTTPGWVYVMLIVMGIGFIGGAVAFILFVPQPTGTIVGVDLAASWAAACVFFSVRALRGRQATTSASRRDGTPATATLLAANTTGMVDQQRAAVEAAPADRRRRARPYETTLKLLTYSPPGNGATFSVRVDPARREHVVLRATTVPPATGGSDADPTLGRAGSPVRRSKPRCRGVVMRACSGDGTTTTVVNPDGSTTITTSSTTVQSGAPLGRRPRRSSCSPTSTACTRAARSATPSSRRSSASCWTADSERSADALRDDAAVDLRASRS